MATFPDFFLDATEDEQTARIVVVGIVEIALVVELQLVVIGLEVQRVLSVLPKYYSFPSRHQRNISISPEFYLALFIRLGGMEREKRVSSV